MLTTPLPRFSSRRTTGFSLIELIVVVLIIGVLIGVALPAFLRQRQTTQDRAAQADLTTAGKHISAFYLAHGESFEKIEFYEAEGEEPGVPTNVADDWPSHAGEPIRARVVSEDVACLEAVTPRGQEWTLVVVAQPVAAPAIPVGRWWGAGPASNWCDDTTSISNSIDSDGDGFSDAVEGAQGTDPNDPTDTPSGEPSDGLLTPPGTGSSSTSPTTAPPTGGEGPNTKTVTEDITVPAGDILGPPNGDWYVYCPPGYNIVDGWYTVTPTPESHSGGMDTFEQGFWVAVDNSTGSAPVTVEVTIECEESTDSGSGDGAPVETGFSPTGWGFCQPGGYYWAEGTVGNYDHITAVFSYDGPAAPGEGNATVQLGPDDWVWAGDEAWWRFVLYADDIEGYDPNLVDYTWSFWHNGDRIGVASNYGYDEQCH